MKRLLEVSPGKAMAVNVCLFLMCLGLTVSTFNGSLSWKGLALLGSMVCLCAVPAFSAGCRAMDLLESLEGVPDGPLDKSDPKYETYVSTTCATATPCTLHAAMEMNKQDTSGVQDQAGYHVKHLPPRCMAWYPADIFKGEFRLAESGVSFNEAVCLARHSKGDKSVRRLAWSQGGVVHLYTNKLVYEDAKGNRSKWRPEMRDLLVNDWVVA